ncbi:MAG: hypothetical protein J2P15_05785 [Micromonosporaceae bacterium]|nr:hypothetical protein [Micromonosporaceae bacterium]
MVDAARVNLALQRFLDRSGGAATWAAACTATSEGIVEWAARSGQVLRPHYGVVADPAHPGARLRSALLRAGRGAALSHTTALSIWRLAQPSTPVHVMTGQDRRIRVPGIVAHRRAGFQPEPPWAVVRDGLMVTALDTTLVDSWPLLAGAARRGPLIAAVADRMTTAERVAAALAARPRLRQRAQLAELLALLAAGCHSELELWGFQHVFTGPGFERLRWQVPVRLSGRRIYLDALDEDSATNFELDGAAYHTAAVDRARDVRRDAQLAGLGILTMRFTYQRLYHDVPAVRGEALAAMAARRGLGERSRLLVTGTCESSPGTRNCDQ